MNSITLKSGTKLPLMNLKGKDYFSISIDPYLIWNRIQRKNGCFIWLGCKNKRGYGSIKIAGKTEKTRRVAYFLAYGPFHKDLHVLHSCDNPSCINPEHLSIGTHKDNMRDMSAKGRNASSRKTACPNGHSYSGYNLKITLGARTCRTCRNEQWNRWAHKVGRTKERSSA